MNQENNFAFIDSQNFYLGMRDLGWKVDFDKLRIYLKQKYKIRRAFMFFGYIHKNEGLYRYLEKAGFELVFKPVIKGYQDKFKGNCDVDLTLRSMIEYGEFDKAFIITSDGDFYSLIKYLCDNSKLLVLMSLFTLSCSKLLKIAAKDRIQFIGDLKNKLEITKKDTT